MSTAAVARLAGLADNGLPFLLAAAMATGVTVVAAVGRWRYPASLGCASRSVPRPGNPARY